MTNFKDFFFGLLDSSPLECELQPAGDIVLVDLESERIGWVQVTAHNFISVNLMAGCKPASAALLLETVADALKAFEEI